MNFDNSIEVSVVIATYNHAPFVRAALDSVLAQVAVNFEVLVADDGSEDGTPDVIRKISDTRIKFISHPVNRGACIVTNELISRARGEFVAVMNSDDIWLSPNKLKFQVDLMRAQPELGASFGRVEFIDTLGAQIAKDNLSFGTVFDQPNRTQGEWLRRFFDLGNCLCHPSVLIRRKIYSELGLLDNRLRQLPDFDMWTRLLKVYPIHVSEHATVGFRILPGENASAQTPVNTYRTINEHFLLAADFFKDFTPDLIEEGFSDLLSSEGIDSSEQCEIEGALMMLNFAKTSALATPYHISALLKLHSFLGKEYARDLLEKRYGIDDRFFQSEMGKFGSLRPDLIAEDARAPLRQEIVLTNASQKEFILNFEKKIEELDKTKKKLDETNDEIEKFKSYLKREKEINVELRNSNSWRLTAPIRATSTLLRKFLR